jgi:XTP/dITP diphosphohydrolase
MEVDVMKIIVASNNQDKIREIKSIFTNYEIVSLKDMNINIDVEETGSTFEENAYIKAKAIYDLTGEMVLADDSGIEIEALNWAPGIYSARFAGNHNDEANNDLVLEKLKNETNRTARYACALCLFYKDGTHKIILEHCYGKITQERIGTGGFGYDPLFYLEEINKTFGQVSLEEKNKYSHRAKALRKLKEVLV